MFPKERPESGFSICSEEEFRENFSAFTHDIFNDFDFSNIIIIGGSLTGNEISVTIILFII